MRRVIARSSSKRSSWWRLESVGAGDLATLGGGGEFEGTLEQAIELAW